MFCTHFDGKVTHLFQELGVCRRCLDDMCECTSRASSSSMLLFDISSDCKFLHSCTTQVHLGFYGNLGRENGMLDPVKLLVEKRQQSVARTERCQSLASMQVIIFSSNLVPCHIQQLGSKKSMDALLGGTQVQRF